MNKTCYFKHSQQLTLALFLWYRCIYVCPVRVISTCQRSSFRIPLTSDLHQAYDLLSFPPLFSVVNLIPERQHPPCVPTLLLHVPWEVRQSRASIVPLGCFLFSYWLMSGYMGKRGGSAVADTPSSLFTIHREYYLMCQTHTKNLSRIFCRVCLEEIQEVRASLLDSVCMACLGDLHNPSSLAPAVISSCGWHQLLRNGGQCCRYIIKSGQLLIIIAINLVSDR